MCGICGVIDWTGAGDAPAIVRRMTPTMHHRGPDDQGISDFGFRIADLEKLHCTDAENTELAQRGSDNSWSNGRQGSLAIGMTRLSIIDIDGGHQPVFNEDGLVGAVLNGEIYNFQELRRQLEDRGHTIRTRSDSEVMVHAYEEWGEQCVEHFEGMFAIAVWDRRQPPESRNAGEGARAPSRKAPAKTRSIAATEIDWLR